MQVELKVLLAGVLMRATRARMVFSPFASAFAIAGALVLSAASVEASDPSPLLEHFTRIRSASETGWCSPLDPSDQPIRTPSIMSASSSTPAETDIFTLFASVISAFESHGLRLKVSLIVAPGTFANAYIHGNDQVVITAALASSVRDRSELAFVFAHELAHLALEHSDGLSVHDEIAADELALLIIEALGLNPCAGADVLDRLSSPLSASLISVTPRLDALHEDTLHGCG